MTLPNYEIYAIKYATRDAKRPAHFVGGDPHDTPMPMDYFVWLVRNAERTIVIDRHGLAAIHVRAESTQPDHDRACARAAASPPSRESRPAAAAIRGSECSGLRSPESR